MAVTLLPATYLLLLVLVHERLQRSLRESMLIAALGCALFLTGVTEALSLAGMLTARSVTLAWTLAVTVLLGCLASNRFRVRPCAVRFAPGATSSALVAGVAVILFTTGLTALLTPPNNYDSMTYHMSRVAHWIQNSGVHHYPTNFLPQLHQNPWAEFGVLHLQLLSGSDRFANLLQWTAMGGSLVVVSLVAKQFGGDGRAQLLATVIAGTIPMGVLQATTTQNDYISSFWFVFYTLVILRICASAEGDLRVYAAAGAVLGLAVLTKATMYLFALPFTAWLAVHVIRRCPRLALRGFAVIAIAALLVNAGHYARNYRLYGSVLGPGQEGYRYNGVDADPRYKYTNDAFSGPLFLANTLRNLAVHLGTPSYRMNRFVERFILDLHAGLGVSPDDRRVIFEERPFFLARTTFSEDYSGNLLHLLLIAMVAGWLCVRRRQYRRHPMAAYYAGLALAFSLFCLALKWQPYNSRLHLPLFVAAAPVIAVVLRAALPPMGSVAVGGILIIAAAPWCVLNAGRELLGPARAVGMPRVDQYFVKNPEMLEPYREATQAIRAAGCNRVGLSMNGADYEYPLWVLLQDAGSAPVRIEHVDVANVSRRLQHGVPFTPCAIISTRSHASAAPEGFRLEAALHGVRLYLTDRPPRGDLSVETQ
jgi:hypothetical protein